MNNKGVIWLPFALLVAAVFGAVGSWNYVQTKGGAARLQASRGLDIGTKWNKAQPVWAQR